MAQQHHRPLLLLLSCLALCVSTASSEEAVDQHHQLSTASSEEAVDQHHQDTATAADAALAQQLGVAPHVLITASRLARRRPRDIVQLLAVNPSATLDTATGAIVFGCDVRPGPDAIWDGGGGHTHPAHPAPPQGLAVWDERDLSQVFQLHSRPLSNKTIYLEFRGCVTEGTEGWNRYYNVTRIETPPYDTDGNATWFSDAERQDVITVWAGVAEAFARWDVDVTTADPGVDGLERSDLEDARYGIRVCVGGTSDWTSTSIGGIATLNSFGWINNGTEVYRDAFAFSSALTDLDGSVNLGFIWKTIVHEVGHSLGLIHKGYKSADSNATMEYYTIPPGPRLWAPSMGVPGMAQFAQWSNGEYPAGMESTNVDDELSIISNTLELLPDEGGASASTATPLCNATACTPQNDSDSQRRPSWVTATLSGRISDQHDADWFELAVASAQEPFMVRLTVHDNYHKTVRLSNGQQRPDTWRVSNLRPEVTFAEPGVKVAPTAAVDTWTWQQDFEVTVPEPGTYRFAVQPSVVLDSAGTTTLPSSYGNLGSYELTVSWPNSLHDEATT